MSGPVPGDEGRRAADHNLERALLELPLFPLPSTVFFPHTLLPLHVFETRYRQLTEDVLADHQHLAVVKIDEDALNVPVPGISRVAGVGRIVHYERLPDGRFHLLLQGIARAELIEELPAAGRLYRRARARCLSADTDVDATVREVQALRSCYARLLEHAPDHKDALGDLPLKVDAPEVLADVVCAAAIDDVGLRQAALEERSLARRLRLAHDALATLLLKSFATEAAPMH